MPSPNWTCRKLTAPGDDVSGVPPLSASWTLKDATVPAVAVVNPKPVADDVDGSNDCGPMRMVNGELATSSAGSIAAGVDGHELPAIQNT